MCIYLEDLCFDVNLIKFLGCLHCQLHIEPTVTLTPHWVHNRLAVHSTCQKLNLLEIWKDHFLAFARALKDFSAPYDNLAIMFDCHDIDVCWPGGLWCLFVLSSPLDHGELYTGAKAKHLIKCLSAQFPYSIRAAVGQFKESSHNGRCSREGRWLDTLKDIAELFAEIFLFKACTGTLALLCHCSFKQV